MVDRQGWLEDAPQLRCALSFDHATLRWAAEDFGHIIRHRPVAVLRPASAADIASIVTYARSKDLPVVARGQGHGTLGHARRPAVWSSLTFLFALLRTAPPDDSATLARMQRANRLLTERALKLGGRTYLG